MKKILLLISIVLIQACASTAPVDNKNLFERALLLNKNPSINTGMEMQYEIKEISPLLDIKYGLFNLFKNMNDYEKYQLHILGGGKWLMFFERVKVIEGFTPRKISFVYHFKPSMSGRYINIKLVTLLSVNDHE